MSITIKRRNGEVIITGKYDSIAAAIKAAIESRADLYGADLSRADLSRANLYGANLYGADLSDANLYDANLYGADLSRADLSRANLSRANLYGADLSRANLYGADLSDANLYDANLYGADLSRANLYGADLSRANLYGADLSDANLYDANLYGADLSRADLSRANLSRAKNADLAIARTRILPEGDIIGWKKCCRDVLVKLLIPADAKRSHAFGRKCRAERAKVLEIVGAEIAHSKHDPGFIYRVGEEVTPAGSFHDDWREECAGGIHFFISRAEAEAY